MRKNYKVKEVNKIKLKTYLTNANTKSSTGHSRNTSRKYNSPQRNNVY